eukprot:378379-Pleurochrysis_carterae.AAC.3
MKDGRMSDAIYVGVLVGVHDHGVAGLPLNVAHHVSAAVFEEMVSRSMGRRRSATRNSGFAASERKGYHTFRCGDVVH